METKIASYQEKGVRLQLIKMYNYNPDNPREYKPGIPMVFYQIRKNRKVICNLKWITPARQKFNALIQQELLQTSIDINTKIYKIQINEKFYAEKKELTKYEYQTAVYNNIHNIERKNVTYDQISKRYLELKEITYEEYMTL